MLNAKNFLNKLTTSLSSSTLRNIAVVMLGAGGSQLLLLLASPVLSRIYSPLEFGHVALAMAVASISGTFVTLRYETTIQLPKEQHDARLLLALSINLAIALSLLLSALAVAYQNVAPPDAPLTSLRSWLVAAVVAGFGVAMMSTVTFWYNRRTNFKRSALLKIFQAATLIAVSILLGTAGANTGLMLGYLTSMVLSTAICVVWLRKEMVGCSDGKEILSVARRFISTPKYLLPANMMDVVTLQIPVVLVAVWFSDSLAGHFGLAWRVVAAPIALVGAAVGQVFYQRAADAWPRSDALKALLHKTWIALALAGIVPMLVVLTFGTALFGFVFGKDWEPAGHIASILSVMVFGMLIASPTSTIFLVMGLQRWMPIFSAVQLLYRPLAIYIGSRSGDLALGLWIWVFCELVAMLLYHLLAYTRLATQGEGC